MIYDAMLKGEVKKGRQAQNAIMDRIRHDREKLSTSEEQLARLCYREADAAALESTPKRRRKTKTTDDQRDTKVIQFQYKRDFQGLLRTRAYVAGDGAQRFPLRRVLRYMCPKTIDFDIENSIFVIFYQFLVKI